MNSDFYWNGRSDLHLFSVFVASIAIKLLASITIIRSTISKTIKGCRKRVIHAVKADERSRKAIKPARINNRVKISLKVIKLIRLDTRSGPVNELVC